MVWAVCAWGGGGVQGQGSLWGGGAGPGLSFGVGGGGAASPRRRPGLLHVSTRGKQHKAQEGHGLKDHRCPPPPPPRGGAELLEAPQAPKKITDRRRRHQKKFLMGRRPGSKIGPSFKRGAGVRGWDPAPRLVPSC